MTLALKFVTTYIIDLMVRAVMDLIRSVGLGVLVLGFISPPGYFSGIGVDVTQKTPLFTMFFLNAAYQTVLATSRS